MNLLEVKQEFFRRLGEMMEGMSIEEEKETISKINTLGSKGTLRKDISRT